jgi:hypothetical protein
MADMPETRCARRLRAWRLRIIKRFDAAGFEVLPKRWDRQRTFLRGSAAIAAWLGS